MTSIYDLPADVLTIILLQLKDKEVTRIKLNVSKSLQLAVETVERSNSYWKVRVCILAAFSVEPTDTSDNWKGFYYQLADDLNENYVVGNYGSPEFIDRWLVTESLFADTNRNDSDDDSDTAESAIRDELRNPEVQFIRGVVHSDRYDIYQKILPKFRNYSRYDELYMKPYVYLEFLASDGGWNLLRRSVPKIRGMCHLVGIADACETYITAALKSSDIAHYILISVYGIHYKKEITQINTSYFLLLNYS